MAIDMRQFHQTFFEESLEGLSDMESELLRLEKTSETTGNIVVADQEILNTIFRAAHSIKGGSSTFGFSDVAAFAHVLESRLDDLREGRRQPNRHIIGLLLLSVDCLRNLIIAARTGKDPEKNYVDSIRLQLENIQGESESTPLPKSSKPQSDPEKTCHWQIKFRPNQQMFRTGNDPLRILRELAELGNLKTIVDVSSVPSWEQLDPEECHLAWNLELIGTISRETIEEIFSWVAGDCELEITEKKTQMPAMSQRTLTETIASMDSHAATLRVSVPKVDALINTVGELVITQTMLSQITTNFSFENLSKLFAGIAQLERNTRELQESVMRIRMLPLSFAFNRLPRLVHDMSQKLGKKVELAIQGAQTEIDKTVIDSLIDPLLHLVRNCLDHGIEFPAERHAAGKPETGTIEIKAYQKGGNVMIDIHDDGRGLQHDLILAKAVSQGLVSADAKPSEQEISEMIFYPGLSTVKAVSDISGRGVGMDVVRTNIRKLDGNIEVSSQSNIGTYFSIRLPLTLAILDGLSVQVGEHVYILPLVSILESVSIRMEQISRPAGGAELFGLRDEYLPLIRLYELFGIEPRSTDITKGLLVIVESDGKKAGLFVDDLLGQQQIVIKSLTTHYRKVEGISAATILGDGMVAMILDVAGLIHMAHTGSHLRNINKQEISSYQEVIPSHGQSLDRQQGLGH
jgi:two-component system chemotaxis sensor kinase CheA